MRKLLLLSFVGCSLQASLAWAAGPPGARLNVQPRRITLGSLVGVLEGTPGTANDLKIQLTYRTLEPNRPVQVQYLRLQRQMMVRQAAIMRARNPGERQRQLRRLIRDARQLQRSRLNLFRIREVKKSITLPLADDVKVRYPRPPEAFDNKGRIKRYTPAELRELKGPGNLPGFPSDRSILTSGQTVYVCIARPVRRKGEPRGATKPVISLVLVVAEPRR